eukprot:TRINITY_DN164_c2_g1_i1.p1 TRINITY_DN164_c2_g1~~TRINITY_DN164_c2_g1_i1.p1  ORF type:complete len:443 (-),score=-47.70 TRINITY_DN164_c2_g1_i1:484-1641(-)
MDATGCFSPPSLLDPAMPFDPSYLSSNALQCAELQHHQHRQQHHLPVPGVAGLPDSPPPPMSLFMPPMLHYAPQHPQHAPQQHPSHPSQHQQQGFARAVTSPPFGPAAHPRHHHHHHHQQHHHHQLPPLHMLPRLVPSPPLPPGSGFGDTCDLCDMDDPSFYSTLSFRPEQQAVVLTSQIKASVSDVEKTRWLDMQLSARQCPYPIRRIEFTHAGDAVVEFISPVAMAKALQRAPLLWGRPACEPVATRACTEADIGALLWVGVTAPGEPLRDLMPQLKQALQPYGEVRGECAPHPSACEAHGHAEAGMGAGAARAVKLFFAPRGRKRLPPSILIARPKGFPPVHARVFTPHGHGPLAVKCADFGPNHSPAGCPMCCDMRMQWGA